MKSPLIFAVLGLVATGCIGALDPPTIVVTPRILAITASRPEAAPGEDITMGVMAWDPEGRALSYDWTVCVGVDQILGSSQLSSATPSETCLPVPGAGHDATVTIPGAVTAGIVDNLPMIAERGGFPVEAIDAILATAGLSFEVHVDVRGPDGDVLVSGYKRVAVTTRATPTTNPPPLEYLVAGTLVRSAIDPFGDPFECVVSRPIVLHTRERVIFAPQDDPETWIESFPIFDYTGGIRSGTENAYYSWYATTTVPLGTPNESSGAISAETTRPPDRDVFYEAPSVPGTVRFFFVLRDGHLGTRACGFDVTIVEADEMAP